MGDKYFSLSYPDRIEKLAGIQPDYNVEINKINTEHIERAWKYLAETLSHEEKLILYTITFLKLDKTLANQPFSYYTILNILDPHCANVELEVLEVYKKVNQFFAKISIIMPWLNPYYLNINRFIKLKSARRFFDIVQNIDAQFE